MNQSSSSKSFGARVRELASWPLLLPIQVYRKLISPFLAPRCRYYPTCSTYAVEAVKQYGPIRGGILAAWRVVRCNPFSDGGFDHVEDQQLFKAKARHARADDCADRHDHHHGATA